MGKLDGKIALIIDGSDGIGFTIAQQFVSEGAYVFITGRSKEALDAAVKKIDDKHITAIRANSAELDDIDNIINTIPGTTTDTPMLRKSSLMDRLDHSFEIAKTAVFLASDDSSYITDIELFVDSGLSQIQSY
ncbi:unnamed protein product [Rotaria sordida]|uniref:Uncharacterized protein n=1 Tax=Rotaria sordida TaxID=392033 RepID=A0A814VA45_9BILA|nr:unnamed protein product [Rotaria sordida]